MYDIPKETPFGAALVRGVHQPDEGLISITGTRTNGYLVHKDFANENLSKEAIQHGEPFGDFLSYPKETTGLILAYELPEKGMFSRLKKTERRMNLVKMIEFFPDYAKDRNVQMPSNGKNKNGNTKGHKPPARQER